MAQKISGKQILTIALISILFTNFPNFVFGVCVTNNSEGVVFLRNIVTYIFPIILLFWRKDIFIKSQGKIEWIEIVLNIVTTIICFWMIAFLIMHTVFDLRKLDCIKTDKKTIENYKQCILEAEKNRFNPF